MHRIRFICLKAGFCRLITTWTAIKAIYAISPNPFVFEVAHSLSRPIPRFMHFFRILNGFASIDRAVWGLCGLRPQSLGFQWGWRISNFKGQFFRLFARRKVSFFQSKSIAAWIRFWFSWRSLSSSSESRFAFNLRYLSQ